MLLNHSRYAGILCEKVKSKTILYNPALMGAVAHARQLLKKTAGVYSSKELVENINETAGPEDVSGTAAEWKEWLENLTMTPVSVPKFHEEKDYEAFIQKHHLLLTEIFSPAWDRFLGSSRHLLMGNVQMKGCGLSLPVRTYQYMNGSGVYGLSLALKGFIYSGLMDTTVPLGSGGAIAVQWAPWSSVANPLGIYLRELKIPRMIQVGPELSQSELIKIQAWIQKKLGVSSAKDLAQMLTAQLAAMVIIGGRANCSPDNLLIDGQFIDEETWHWPEDLGSRRISFEFECDQGQFDWKTAKLSMSTCLHMKNSLHDVHRYLEILYGSAPRLNEMEKMFFSHVQNAMPDFDKRIWERGLELSQNFKSVEFQAWLKDLETAGWLSSTEYFKDQGMALHLSKPRPESGELADKFNRQRRPDFWKVAIKLSKLNPDEIDAVELSNSIQLQIGASGFILPFRFMQGKGFVKNVLSMKDFLHLTFQKWPQLKNKTLDMVVWDGNSEVTHNKVTASTKLDGNCIPLSFRVHGLNEKTYTLPCLKTVLTS